MSYDISLYKSEFLHRAIEQQLGDWTTSDPIPDADRAAIEERLLAKGYMKGFGHPQFGDTYAHPNAAWGVQASLYRGSVSFTVPSSGPERPATYFVRGRSVERGDGPRRRLRGAESVAGASVERVFSRQPPLCRDIGVNSSTPPATRIK